MTLNPNYHKQVTIDVDKESSYYFYKDLINSFYTNSSTGIYNRIYSLKSNFNNIEYFFDRLKLNDETINNVIRKVFNELHILSTPPKDLADIMSEGEELFVNRIFNFEMKQFIFITNVYKLVKDAPDHIRLRLSICLAVMLAFELYPYEIRLKEFITTQSEFTRLMNSHQNLENILEGLFFQITDGKIQIANDENAPEVLLWKNGCLYHRNRSTKIVYFNIYKLSSSISSATEIKDLPVITKSVVPTEYFDELHELHHYLIRNIPSHLEAQIKEVDKDLIPILFGDNNEVNTSPFNKFAPQKLFSVIEYYLFHEFITPKSINKNKAYRDSTGIRIFTMLKEYFPLTSTYNLQILTGLYLSSMGLLNNREQYINEQKKITKNPDWKEYLKKQVNNMLKSKTASQFGMPFK